MTKPIKIGHSIEQNLLKYVTFKIISLNSLFSASKTDFFSANPIFSKETSLCISIPLLFKSGAVSVVLSLAAV